MANTASNVTTGKPKSTGGVWVAASGTTLPTDATTALSSTYACLGYISEDGLTMSTDMESDSIIAWGGDTVLTAQTGKTYTFTFTPIEVMNKEVWAAQFGSGNVSENSGKLTITGDTDEVKACVFVFEIAMSDGGYMRIVVPSGKLSSLGDFSFNNSDPVGAEMEITALPSSGTSFTVYIAPGT